jgi:pyruvate/oxaloacetate carboxyltransferase
VRTWASRPGDAHQPDRGYAGRGEQLVGERYKIISQEVKDYCKGLYGRAPAPLNPELVKKALGDEEPITGRPADSLEPGFEKAKEEIGALAHSDEDVLSYALFPQVAREFFEKRAAGELVPIEEPRIFPAQKPAAAAAAPAAPAKTAVAPQRVARPQPNYSLWRVAGRVRSGR